MMKLREPKSFAVETLLDQCLQRSFCMIHDSVLEVKLVHSSLSSILDLKALASGRSQVCQSAISLEPLEKPLTKPPGGAPGAGS